MTDKKRLNTILRLRLFFSTEKEYGEKVGLSLKKNHFNKLKPFPCEAFFSKFAEECKKYSQGKVDLAKLICQYEITSKYFQNYIKDTVHKTNKDFVQYLLNKIYLGETPDVNPHNTKVISLCERYDSYNAEDEMNMGILILLTYDLLPTFNNGGTDITDIIADFQKAYNILFEIAQSQQSGASIQFKEITCLKEMRDLIEDEQAGDNYLNRLLLIYITNDVLDRIFALKNPAKLRELGNEFIRMSFNIPRLWRCDDDADNIVWEFVGTNVDSYYLYRKEIDYKNKRIHYTQYHLLFKDLGYKTLCYTRIIRPSYNWYNMLKRELPADSSSYDYTEIEYEMDKHTAKQLTFTQESPISEKPMTLKAIKKQEVLNYYIKYLDHEGVASDYEDLDDESQYAVAMYTFEVSVSNNAILFNDDNAVYKLDKFDEEGNETIPGICALNNTDNYVYAELVEDGIIRHFICLDSINQNLDLEELLDQPFFHKIESLDEIF